MTTHKTAIRHYIKALLKKHVDVGERVFVNVPGPVVFPEELPAVFVTIGNEKNELGSGNKNFIKSYKCALSCVVSVIIDRQVFGIDDDTSFDVIDEYAQQISFAMHDDCFFTKEIEGYDPDTYNEGLLQSLKLEGTQTYISADETTPSALVHDMTFTLNYEQSVTNDKRWKIMTSFGMDIIRSNSDESTVDRVLISGEGILP